ncbi:unnamed protein product [Moneuplotes crassus]|uniref:Uncharacterized protein n=1 Tax=Euplotes crassus TaxID=5936 RepID=A0AAD1U5N7_EUPCR|nr:unnamed protein product [Moneuplotes crassus]
MDSEERILGFEGSEDEIEGEDDSPNPLTAVKQEVNYLSYDYYGTRMVTCGADQKLKIWEKSDNKDDPDISNAEDKSPGEHTKYLDEFENLISPRMKTTHQAEGFKQGMYLAEEWEAHSGPIVKVQWAHPQYGQLFASCADSGELFIWEEKIKRKPGSSHELIREWTKVASLEVTKDKIQDIKFGPEHVGLKILVLYTNGKINIFQAKNVTNLQKWELISNLDSINKNGCNSVDWNPNEEYDMFVVCSNANIEGSQFEELEEQDLKSKDPSFNVSKEEKKENNRDTEFKETLRQMKNKVLQFFKLDDKDYEEFLMIGKEIDYHDDDKIESENESIEWDLSKSLLSSIFDVKFAPSVGRSYTVLATCDSSLNISFWKLDMSKYIDEKETSRSQISGLQKASTQIGETEHSFHKNNEPGEKVLSLITSISLRREEDEILKTKIPEILVKQEMNLSFSNQSNEEIELKASQIYLCWNITGTMLAISLNFENIKDGHVLCIYAERPKIQNGMRKLHYQLVSTFG